MADHDAQLRAGQDALRESRFADGLAAAEAVLAAEPDHADALYLAAVACRYLNRFDAAQGWLERLNAARPEYGRGWQEQGHLNRAMGRRDAAIDAYRRACRFNPALEAGWRALADQLVEAGRPGEAQGARAEAERLKALPRELAAVANHLYEGRLLRAEEICRHFLRRYPKHTEAMRLLARIARELGIVDDAEFLLESAVAFAPDDVTLRLDYIQALRKRQKFARAREEAEALHARDPGNPLFQSHLAIERMQTGDYDGAFDLFDRILQRLPNDPATLTSRGHALKTRGLQDEAIASYRAATQSAPTLGDAWYALANLKTYRFDDAEMATMRETLARGDIAFMDRVHTSFALAKACEDRGEYEDAFRHYAEGNDLKRRQSGYDADRMAEELERQKSVCTPDLFAAHEVEGHAAPDPIFIVGLPRAGSTLLEQILASHSMVDGTLELPDILSLAHRLRGRRAGASEYPQVLHRLTPQQLSQFGQEYIANTRIHRQGAPFFIDKMPNNFRHIGLIHLILPNAKIIDARRNAMDCCFSGFKQLFAEGQEFTYGLSDIGRYYRDYVDLMEHWDRVLPNRILHVQHEDVLDDLEGQVRRMLDYLGLPFEQACLDFHKTDRAVRTASSEQVRRPINRSGVDAWKPFEPWLDELKAALGPQLVS
ncbi:tetratricopeptide repeat-containing sulfotransferase family protein [Croceicoccus naphthovorans]|uniref:Uncharacterized protein n=1 Tax=Croceicoccus naphthovorans TaxID=1348774 RepID=A0A0G3XGX8_9SPHN|nr:tetratricopeptide repeat-containing sulfotransferase family protein [Croceicoccus naphthovorans]AKM09603.1 hypothetical protein AB433_05805 [Croceicoccus naphthovorans]MBB3989624.1 tetratricopeptide (TPR) repeat protein [Croceicoccus naphthovorans]